MAKYSAFAPVNNGLRVISIFPRIQIGITCPVCKVERIEDKFPHDNHCSACWCDRYDNQNDNHGDFIDITPKQKGIENG